VRSGGKPRINVSSRPKAAPGPRRTKAAAGRLAISALAGLLDLPPLSLRPTLPVDFTGCRVHGNFRTRSSRIAKSRSESSSNAERDDCTASRDNVAAHVGAALRGQQHREVYTFGQAHATARAQAAQAAVRNTAEASRVAELRLRARDGLRGVVRRVILPARGGGRPGRPEAARLSQGAGA